MSEKAKELGIPEADLKRALILVRNLRAMALSEGLDPRATRIALVFANKVDLHFAGKRLSPQNIIQLEHIAHTLFIEAGKRGRWL